MATILVGAWSHVLLAAPLTQDTAAPETLQHPIDVAVAADGTAYVADRDLPGIWKIQEGKLSIFFQAQKKFGTPLNAIRCLALDAAGNLLAGDSATWNVYRFDAQGTPTAIIPQDSPKKIGKPMALIPLDSGEIWVADLEVHRVRKLSSEGQILQDVAVPSPIGLAAGAEDRLYVLTRVPDPIRQVNASGEVSTLVKDRPFQFPGDMSATADGHLLVSDSYGKCVWRMKPGEAAQKWVAEGLKHPVGVATQGERVFVVDARAKMVFEIQADGSLKPLLP